MKRDTVKRVIVLMMFAVLFPTVLAAQSSVISGTILGEDGKPLPQAHVSLLRPNQTRPITTVSADAAGNYAIETVERGLVVLQFSGVGHKAYPVAALLEDTVRAAINVTLEPFDFYTRFDSIKVIGDFNGFVYDSGLVMQRGEDGTFSVQLPATRAVNYQLLGISNDGPVCSPTCAGYAYDGEDAYYSVAVPQKGVVTIVFDSTQLVYGTTGATATFDDPKMEIVAKLYGDIVKRRESYQRALTANRNAGRSIYQFSYKWNRDLDRLFKQLAKEKDPLTRQLLLISYLDLGTMGAIRDLRPAAAKWALGVIPPTSPLWSINPKLIPLAIQRTNQPDSLYQEYLACAISEHSDPEVTSLLLYDGLTVAYTSNETDKAQEYYRKLINDFGKSRYAAMARAQFTIDPGERSH